MTGMRCFYCEEPSLKQLGDIYLVLPEVKGATVGYPLFACQYCDEEMVLVPIVMVKSFIPNKRRTDSCPKQP